MKNLNLWITLFATMLFAACGGDDFPTKPPYENLPSGSFQLSIAKVVEAQTQVTVIISSKGTASYGYIIEPHTSTTTEYSGEQVYAAGNIGPCNSTGTTTFTIPNLKDNTVFDLYVCGKGGGNVYTDVAHTTVSTQALPEYTLVYKGLSQIKASVRLPNSVAESSVVKWAVCDLATYNYNGGNANMDGILSVNEKIYNNYFTEGYDFDISNQNSTFVHEGVTIRRYAELQPGQPMVLLLGEYGPGSHAEWGEGHYSPLFTNGGYLRKEVITTVKPGALSAAPTIYANVTPSGKGNITISVPEDATSFYYIIIDSEQYADILALFNGSTEYMQWFVSSAFAAEHYNSTRAIGKTVAINPEALNISKDKEYYVLVTAWGDDGQKQSFAEHVFSLPPTAPLATDNTIIAHRGGSKEAGKTNCPDNSIASLKYAMGLGCYASEADIYGTKDNKIIVAHANGECKINGLYPWEHTLAEIQAAGRLTNGEIVPSLEDYIRAVMVKGSKTKLCLDVKAITEPTFHDSEAVKACERACEIIKEMEAQQWCTFICSGRTNITKNCAKYANAAGIAIGAMGDFTPSQYKNYGYAWHNRDKKYGISESEVNEYINAGLEVSVFTLDTDADWQLVSSYWQKLKGITTNYPKRMLEKTK